MIDPASQAWIEVEAHLRKRIHEIQERLGQHGLSITDTEYARGRLAEAKELLSLPQTDQPQPPLVAPNAYEDA